MMRFVIVSVLLVCLIVTTATASGSRDSQLEQTYKRFSGYLSSSSAEPIQRNLVAFSAAVSTSGAADLSDLYAVYASTTHSAGEVLQADTSFYWDLDTEAWIGELRVTYTYDSTGLMTSDLTEAFNGSAWEQTWRTNYGHDTNGRMDTVVSQKRIAGVWTNMTRTILSNYNANDLPGQFTNQSWGGASWTNSESITYTYVGGQLSTSLTESWNGGAWEYFSLATYTYTSGNLTQYVMQNWQGGAWVNVSRTVSTYVGGLEMQSLNQNWQGGAWADMTKYDYAYDGQDREVLSTFSMWITVMWMPYYKDTMKYTGDNLTEVISTDLLTNGQSRVQYAYTPGGNKAEEVSANYDMGTMAWINNYRTVWTYSGSGSSDCEGTTGNLDMVGIVDLSDLSLMIAYLTIPAPNKPTLPAPGEANVDGVGIIDLSDLSLLIAYLTVPAPNKPVLPNCP